MARRGRRGEGTTYYSKSDRRWVARWPLGVVDGKRVDKRVKCRTEAEAIAELARLRRAYGAGGNPATQTLDAYLGHAFEDPKRGIEPSGWLRDHGRSVRHSTLVSYDGHVQLHIKPLLGGIVVNLLRPADVKRLVADLERRGKSAATIGLILTTLSVALQVAVADRSIADNPVVGVKRPRIEREPVRALTQDEADRIRAAVAGHWSGPIVRLLLGSGLRLGEACGLDQGDILPGFVRVRRSKTIVRAVPISDDAALALDSALALAPRRGPAEPVFFGPKVHDRLRGSSVSHALPPLLAAAGLGHLTPHALRHGAASLMLADGHPMRVIAEQLGHRNPALTARVYAHVIPEAQRAAVGSLNPRAKAR